MSAMSHLWTSADANGRQRRFSIIRLRPPHKWCRPPNPHRHSASGVLPHWRQNQESFESEQLQHPKLLCRIKSLTELLTPRCGLKAVKTADVSASLHGSMHELLCLL